MDGSSPGFSMGTPTLSTAGLNDLEGLWRH